MLPAPRSSRPVAAAVLAGLLLALLLVPTTSASAIPIKDQPLEFKRAAEATRVHANGANRNRPISTATAGALAKLATQRNKGFTFGRVGECRLQPNHISCPSPIMRGTRRAGTAYLKVYGTASTAKVREVGFAWR